MAAWEVAGLQGDFLSCFRRTGRRFDANLIRPIQRQNALLNQSFQLQHRGRCAASGEALQEDGRADDRQQNSGNERQDGSKPLDFAKPCLSASGRGQPSQIVTGVVHALTG